MSGEAEETNIDDDHAASDAFAKMHAQASHMGNRIAAIAARIADLESSKPWGHAPEYGGLFEKVYHAGEHGAEFVRVNVTELAKATSDGVDTARQALKNSVDLDADGANLFRIGHSKAVGITRNQERAAAAAEIADQQKADE